MKHVILSLFSMAILAMAVVPSISFAAEDAYFVEVGDDVTKDDAQAQWQALVNKNKNLLGKLTLYPKDIVQDGAQMTTRMQAGPIASKAQALKICNKLFAQDVSCFVIEGVNNAPPTAMMHLNQGERMATNNGALPWFSNHGSDIAAAPRVKGEDTAIDGSERAETKDVKPVSTKGDVKLPWLEPKKTEAKDEDQDTNTGTHKKAEVQVAEAIRVPLTETHDITDQIRVSALPELKPSFGTRQLQDQSAEMGNVNSGKGWLDVSGFANEEIAASMWEEVRSANRKQAKTLNMRVSRPAVAASDHNTTLSVGPFANSAEALNFCRSGLQAGDRGLQCSFVANDAGVANAKVMALNAHADAYAQRRRPPENPVIVATDAQNVAKLAPAAGPSRQYWVQVVTADSQMEALKQWEQVKNDNATLIGDLRSSVSAAANDKSSYVVRVGPIVENDKAIRMCSELQKRNVECRVLLYSRGA